MSLVNVKGRYPRDFYMAAAERDVFVRANGFHDYYDSVAVEVVAMSTFEAEFCEWPREPVRALPARKAA